MSEMNNTFNSAMHSLIGQSAKVEGNLVLRPTEFTPEWVKGNIVGGPTDGKEIMVRYPTAEGCMASMEHFTTNPEPTNSKYVDIDRGGTLRIERVTEGKDDIFDCGWMMTFMGCPQQRYYIVTDAHCKYVATDMRDSKNRPIAKIQQLICDTEEPVTNCEEMLDAILECFRTHKAAMLVGDENGRMHQMVYYLGGKRVDKGSWVENKPEEKIAEIREIYEAEGMVEKFNNVLGNNDVSVTAMIPRKVGPGTAENVEKAIDGADKKIRITSVDPAISDCFGIGSRFSTAINRKKDDRNALPEGVAEKFTNAFKAQADKDDLDALANDGWKGISDHTLTTFCADHGVKLKKHPSKGWINLAMVADRLSNHSVGRRIDMALGEGRIKPAWSRHNPDTNREMNSEEIAERLAEHFVAWANEKKIEDLKIVLATFEAKGWKAMSDKNLVDFLVNNPDKECIVDAIIDRRDGMIVSIFPLKWPDPYPKLRVCEDIRKEYWEEIPKAITGVVENLLRVNANVDAKPAATEPVEIAGKIGF